MVDGNTNIVKKTQGSQARCDLEDNSIVSSTINKILGDFPPLFRTREFCRGQMGDRAS